MNKIKITEQQYNTLKNSLLKEFVSSSQSSDTEGSVTLKKNSNPNDIKKLTDKGLNVSLIDEELGEEQEVKYKHKFDGKKLNIYVTKEKGSLEDIMDYVYTIKQTDKVEKAFEKDNVHLYIKDAASGRYQEINKKLEHKYYKNVSGFKNFKTNTSHEDKPHLSDGQ